MNGVAEIRHQMLQYQARTMLLQANLSIGYWAEAITQQTMYLIGYQPPHLKAKPLMKPGQVETLRSSPQSLRCPAYMHVPEGKRHEKFEARAQKMILVGYMDDLRAYKLLHPVTHKATYSRSVVVHEEAVLCPKSTAVTDQLDLESQLESNDSTVSSYDNEESTIANETMSSASSEVTATESAGAQPEQQLQFGSVPPPDFTRTSTPPGVQQEGVLEEHSMPDDSNSPQLAEINEQPAPHPSTKQLRCS